MDCKTQKIVANYGSGTYVYQIAASPRLHLPHMYG